MRWLGLRGIDVYTQNLLRMAASAALFLPLGYVLRPNGMKKAFSGWYRYLAPAALVALSQTFLMTGVLRIGATFSMLIGRMDIVLTVLVGALFFADERSLTKQKGFFFAMLAALAGVAGVVVFRRGTGGNVATAGTEFVIGVISIVLSTSFWVAYGFSVKMVKGGSDSLVILVMINVLATLCQIPIWLVARSAGLVDLDAAVGARTLDLVIIMAGGVIGMAGGLSYIYSVRSVGVTVSQAGVLSLPLFIAAISRFWLGENLSAGQWACGALLLAGLASVLYIEHRSRIRSAPANGTVAEIEGACEEPGA